MGRFIKLMVAALALGAAALCVGANLTNAPGRSERVAHNRAQVERVLAALEAHRARTGGYPAALDDLVPEDLAALPGLRITGSGEAPTDRLHYEPDPARAAFRLSYPVEPLGALPSDAFNVYASETKAWTVGD